jgi:hypothetical protein
VSLFASEGSELPLQPPVRQRRPRANNPRVTQGLTVVVFSLGTISFFCHRAARTAAPISNKPKTAIDVVSSKKVTGEFRIYR